MVGFVRRFRLLIFEAVLCCRKKWVDVSFVFLLLSTARTGVPHVPHSRLCSLSGRVLRKAIELGNIPEAPPSLPGGSRWSLGSLSLLPTSTGPASVSCISNDAEGDDEMEFKTLVRQEDLSITSDCGCNALFVFLCSCLLFGGRTRLFEGKARLGFIGRFFFLFWLG